MEELSAPIAAPRPLKFVTLYQRDFLDNHVVVHSSPVAQLIPRLDPGQLTAGRARTMLENVGRFAADLEILRVQAGEVARFLSIMGGAWDISKPEISRALAGLGDADARAIYSDYVSGVPEAKPVGFYVAFIESRL